MTAREPSGAHDAVVAGSLEHRVVVLMETAQEHLQRAEAALQDGDPRVRDYQLVCVVKILLELHGMLNLDSKEALVANLEALYAHWGRQVERVDEADHELRLRQVHEQMGTIRRAWEHVLFQGEGFSEPPAL